MTDTDLSGAQESVLARLESFGQPDGPSLEEALHLFERLRATPHEARAALGLVAVDGRTPLPEPLLVAVASALVDRGEEGAAAMLLAPASSTPALLLRADLVARAGDSPAALALVERVLYRDIDWPGARERHARWRTRLDRKEAARGPEPIDPRMSNEPDAPFRLLHEVGRGGAGTVYEAEDRELCRKVALKVYHRPDRDRAQLLHEAAVAVALAGSGIVHVFDVDPQHGWLVMQWAGMDTLRARLRSRDPQLRPIVRWTLPLARALARVHAAGWVHHDVKPANVLLQEPSDPLLTDFGTARRLAEPSPPGSLGYVSPERIAGRSSNPRDDVFGFGRILEEVLAALGADAGDGDIGIWRGLASACTGADDARPENGEELLRSIERRQEQSGR